MAAFEDFSAVMDRLLAEDGCPWDRAQTHESLRQHLLEECYEAAEAIDQKDNAALCEELGDILMQIVFHGKLAEKDGAFTTTDIINGISQKMISRHSHIFGEDIAITAEDVEVFWERNKSQEKKYIKPADMLNAVPKSMPALMRAQQVLKRAKVKEELTAAECVGQIRTLLDDLEKNDTSELPANFVGGILFILVKFSVILGINAELSLTNIIEAFINSWDKNIKEDME